MNRNRSTTKNGKVYNNNNEVAILVTNNWGWGWSSEVDPDSMCKFLYYPPLINYILDGGNTVDLLKSGKLSDSGQEIFKDIECESSLFRLGLKNVVVKWIPRGHIFKVSEYDGLETIEYFSLDEWFQNNGT